MAVYCISIVRVTWSWVHPYTMLFFWKILFLVWYLSQHLQSATVITKSQSPVWRSIRTKCSRDSCPPATSKQMEEVGNFQSEKWKSTVTSFFSSPLDCPLPHSAQGPLISPHGSSHKRPERLREIRRAGMLTSSLVATMMTMMMIGWKASSFATCNSHLIVIEVAINHRYHVRWWLYTMKIYLAVKH